MLDGRENSALAASFVHLEKKELMKRVVFVDKAVGRSPDLGLREDATLRGGDPLMGRKGAIEVCAKLRTTELKVTICRPKSPNSEAATLS